MSDLSLPPDVRLRLNDVAIENLVQRTDALTELVALQETELVCLWLVIALVAGIGMKCYTDLRSQLREPHA